MTELGRETEDAPRTSLLRQVLHGIILGLVLYIVSFVVQLYL